jgi:hypothetical protein
MDQDPGSISQADRELINKGIRRKEERPSSVVEVGYWESRMALRDAEIQTMKGFAEASDAKMTNLVKAGLKMDAVIDPETGETIFTHALTLGNKARIEFLYKFGADINGGLTFVINKLGNLDVVKILLGLGCLPLREQYF